jgi:predicted CopG family antitoxin
MGNITLAIPNDLHERMKKHSEIRWSEVIRKTIAEKVDNLEMFDKLSGKNKLTKSDIEEISFKIDSNVAKKLNLRCKPCFK